MWQAGPGPIQKRCDYSLIRRRLTVNEEEGREGGDGERKGEGEGEEGEGEGRGRGRETGKRRKLRK